MKNQKLIIGMILSIILPLMIGGGSWYFKFDKQPIMIAIITCMTIALLMIFTKWVTSREGFSNEEACANLSKAHNLVIKNMEAIPQDAVQGRDQINAGVTYHNMQTRDIILGDEKTSWCSRLNETSKKSVMDAIAKELGQEVEIYEGADFMDMAEKKSHGQGIRYAGTDRIESEYAVV